jgi:hypothetical protein
VSHYFEKEASFDSWVGLLKPSELSSPPEGFTDDDFNSPLALAAHLGHRLSISKGHTAPPDPVCVTLGLQYDMDNNTMSLPEDEVVALSTVLTEQLDKTKATEKELSSLAGTLLKAANVVLAGRFSRNQGLATKRRAFRPKHSIYPVGAFRDDIQ